MHRQYVGLVVDGRRLVYVGSDEANLLAQHKLRTALLDAHQIRHTFVTIPGGHTWHVWRRNLRDLLPLLFR